MKTLRLAGLATAGATLVVVGAEVAHWRASRRLVSASASDGPCGIIVLGYPPRHDGTIHPLGRWRVEMACRAVASLGASTVVFTGGGRPGRPTEAAIMADYAAAQGLPRAMQRTEERSTNTWENVAFSLPLVSHCRRLAIISDPMHAARGRRYLLEQRPGAAGGLVSGGEYVFGERWWLKVPTALYEFGRAIGLRPPLRSPTVR